jgi:hypothetical protein
MTTTTDTGTKNKRLPRWAIALIALLALTAVVAVTVAIEATRNTKTNATPTPTTTRLPPAGDSASFPGANGCLGGTSDLDNAVLEAQRTAPLTEVGAAEFAATMYRWAATYPAPSQQALTANTILAPGATDAARHLLTASLPPQGDALSLSFAESRYHVEVFDGTSAVVSLIATATINPGSQTGLLGGSIHLQAINGSWRFLNIDAARQIDSLLQIGTPYVGGC